MKVINAGPRNAGPRIQSRCLSHHPHASFLPKLASQSTHRLGRLGHIKVAETTAQVETIEDLVLSNKSPEAAPVESLSQEPISWTKQWYPVAVAKLIDPSRPNPVQLLGKNLVIWLDAAGQWRCFEDRCPHRAAPLSEGKIWAEEGTLMCSYHGWKFDPAGDCVRIPQSASAEAEERACTSRRACATTFPIVEHSGVLFVWGESGANAEEECAARPIPVDHLLEESIANGDQITYIMPPFFRDLPYDYQTLVENVADPAHVAFAHHGIQGNRDKVKYGDYEMKVVPEPGQIKVTWDSNFGNGHVAFQPPNIINISSKREDGYHFSFQIYCVPTTPGNCRLVSFSHTNNPKLPSLFKLIKKLPLWLDHVLFRHSVLDGDNVFLHFQEQFLVDKARKEEAAGTATGTAAASAAWRKNYFMPTRADALVASFKNWLDKAGGGGPFGPLHKAPGYPALVTDHRVLLNRYEQHTKNCTACKKALTWVERYRAVAAAVAAIGMGAAIAATVQGAATLGIKAMATRSVASGGIVALLGALVWRWLSQLEQKFYFVDYDHATR